MCVCEYEDYRWMCIYVSVNMRVLEGETRLDRAR